MAVDNDAMNFDLLSILDSIPREQLLQMLQPFTQEQSVLDQEMAMAQQMREQRGPQRETPWGAALGGLGDAVSNVSGAVLQQQGLEKQRALGTRMQEDAVGRVGVMKDAKKKAALEEFLRQRGQGLGFSGPMRGGR